MGQFDQITIGSFHFLSVWGASLLQLGDNDNGSVPSCVATGAEPLSLSNTCLPKYMQVAGANPEIPMANLSGPFDKEERMQCKVLYHK